VVAFVGDFYSGLQHPASRAARGFAYNIKPSNTVLRSFLRANHGITVQMKSESSRMWDLAVRCFSASALHTRRFLAAPPATETNFTLDCSSLRQAHRGGWRYIEIHTRRLTTSASGASSTPITVPIEWHTAQINGSRVA